MSTPTHAPSAPPAPPQGGWPNSGHAHPRHDATKKAALPRYVGLLVAGFVFCLIAGALLGTYANDAATATTDVFGDTVTPNPALLGWGLALLGLGQFLLIPGLIGWGVNASGIIEAVREKNS